MSLCRSIFLVFTVVHNMAQCQFCYLQVLDNSHSDPTFLLLLAPANCSDLLYHSPFCTRMGLFELHLPMKSSSSWEQLLWHLPLLPAPCPALSVPFPTNHWCSAASVALSQANQIFSSESAHQVFRERLHFSVLAFKNCWLSGTSVCNLHSSRFTVTIFLSTSLQSEEHLGTTHRVSPQDPLLIHPVCTAGNCFLNLHHFS